MPMPTQPQIAVSREAGPSATGASWLWRVALVAGAMLLPPELLAQSDVDAPDISACSGTSTTIAPGSHPVTPGRWWNPRRDGTGWDLHLIENEDKLLVTWYTYDRGGNPVWLGTDSNPIDRPNSKWRSPLYSYTYTPQNGLGPRIQVGSVAIRFDPANPLRAAIRWRWTEATDIGLGDFDECIVDFTRPQPTGGNAASTANVTFTGTWYEAAQDESPRLL